MNYRIVADSSSNVLSMDNPRYFSVPMKVRAEKEYIDDVHLDVAQMVADLRNHKGSSGSSCPNVGEWLDAFGDADFVFGTTISKNLSGSYNAAVQAADTFICCCFGQRHSLEQVSSAAVPAAGQCRYMTQRSKPRPKPA